MSGKFKNTGEAESSAGQHALYNSSELRRAEATVSCACGNRALLVTWIPSDYTGGYLKVKCPQCEAEDVLFGDFS